MTGWQALRLRLPHDWAPERIGALEQIKVGQEFTVVDLWQITGKHGSYSYVLDAARELGLIKYVRMERGRRVYRRLQ